MDSQKPAITWSFGESDHLHTARILINERDKKKTSTPGEEHWS